MDIKSFEAGVIQELQKIAVDPSTLLALGLMAGGGGLVGDQYLNKGQGLESVMNFFKNKPSLANERERLDSFKNDSNSAISDANQQAYDNYKPPTLMDKATGAAGVPLAGIGLGGFLNKCLGAVSHKLGPLGGFLGGYTASGAFDDDNHTTPGWQKNLTGLASGVGSAIPGVKVPVMIGDMAMNAGLVHKRMQQDRSFADVLGRDNLVSNLLDYDRTAQHGNPALKDDAVRNIKTWFNVPQIQDKMKGLNTSHIDGMNPIHGEYNYNFDEPATTHAIDNIRNRYGIK